MSVPAPVALLTSRFLDEVDARLPGRVVGLFLHGSLGWGEFFGGSDVDFVAVWDTLPTGAELKKLAEAHRATAKALPAPVFDGFHCTAEDLAGSPSKVGTRPVFYQGAFDAEGTVDINPVTWHELAERAVVVRGTLPPVHTDIEELRAYSRANLTTYWQGIADQLGAATADQLTEFGAAHDKVAWVVLGAGRLHHLLTEGSLTSKSGGGRHVLDHLHPQWHVIAMESLRHREFPQEMEFYESDADRGHDARALLRWFIADATAAG